jgi:hypothetical protein
MARMAQPELPALRVPQVPKVRRVAKVRRVPRDRPVSSSAAVRAGQQANKDFAVQYAGPFEFGVSTTEANVQATFPLTGTIDRFEIVLESNPGGSGKSWTSTLRVGGTDTLLTCTVANTATRCQNLTHSASMTAGQAISVKLQPVPVSSPNVTVVHWRARFTAS